jgi:nucleotide-binding universal stress UspA family protein
MFKTIIWATDGSSAAELALPYAKGLAKAARARLIVVHVDEFSVGKSGGYSVYVDESEAQAAIQKQVEGLRREGLDASLQTSRVLMEARHM